jgi:hypothetical protein
VYVVAEVPETDEVDIFWEKLWMEKIEHIVLVEGSHQQKVIKINTSTTYYGAFLADFKKLLARGEPSNFLQQDLHPLCC